MQDAKEAGRSLEFMKLSHHLAAAQRKRLNKHEAAYEVYQVQWPDLLSHDAHQLVGILIVIVLVDSCKTAYEVH